MGKPKVLIVEDESIVALDLQGSLESLGYVVPLTVATGEEAIAEAESSKPDLILMDIELQGKIDGVEAAARIRDRFRIPIVYLTAYADDDTLRRAKITEPYAYLLKPFEERELHTAIEIALYRHQAEEALRRRDAILAAVSFAAEQFLKAASWEDNIHAALERLGQAAEVSRVYIFENSMAGGGVLLTKRRYEWTAPGIVPQIDNPDLQGFSLRAGGVGRWEEILGQGQPIHGHAREFPASERQVLAAQHIRSLAAMPIFVGQAWWGFIGFDECRSERKWFAAEIDAFKTAASTLGAAIQRTGLHQEIQHRGKEMRTLYIVARSGMTSIRLDEILNRTVDALQKALPAGSISILLVEPETNELVIRASIGVHPGLETARWPLGAGTAGRVVQTGRPALLADVRQYTGCYACDPDTVSVLCVPLQVGQRIIGALNVESRQRAAYGNDDLRLVSILAGHLAAVADYVFIDLPRHPDGASQMAMQQCDTAILVVEREPTSVTAGRVALELLRSWGVRGIAGAIVVSRTVLPVPMSLTEIRSRLGCELVGVVPPAAEACAAAHREGVPLVLHQPDHLAAVNLAEIASRLASDRIAPLKL